MSCSASLNKRVRNTMTDNNLPQFRTEGQPAFPVQNTENDNSAASAAGEETKTDNAQSSGGADNTQTDDKKPFHEDPAVQEYIERQVAKRVEAVETKLSGSISSIRDEFGAARAQNAAQGNIPKWFGGNQEQWDEFRSYNEEQLKQAEERAITRISETSKKEQQLVDDATTFFNTELASIQGDKAMNPTGAAIDPNKLLKFVLDNDLVDSKGRWNYRAGYRLMQAGEPAARTQNTRDRKNFAGATTSEARSETKAPNYKTAADFRKKRPW